MQISIRAKQIARHVNDHNGSFYALFVSFVQRTPNRSGDRVSNPLSRIIGEGRKNAFHRHTLGQRPPER